MSRILNLFFAIFMFLPNLSSLYAQCASLARGAVAFDPKSCQALQPEQFFQKSKPQHKFIFNLDAVNQKQFFDTYRGHLLKGTVSRSQIKQKGLIESQRGLLLGKNISVFIPPTAVVNCSNITQQTVVGILSEQCCNGSGESPCLSGTNYILEIKEQVPRIALDNQKNPTAARSRSEKAKTANEAFENSNFKLAAKNLEEVRKEGKMDALAYYQLGMSYRKLDLCRKAIPPLREFYDIEEQSKRWAADDDLVRKNYMLLARCYARENDADSAVMILGSFLTEPKKYRKEIEESLRERDFNWIDTTKEFKQYREEAQRKL